MKPELPETPQEKPLLLTTKEAAVLLNCSVRTVGRMMSRGELVVRKNGSLTRIPRTSVEAFAKTGRKTRA
jgi:excisionase family DNA binding protein